MANLGETLKTAREEQGLSLVEVAEATHIRKHLLEALEENQFEVFPSAVVIRGLIRNYARFLGLDPIEVLTLYDGNGIILVKGQRLTPKGIEFMNLSMAPRPFNWGAVIFVLLLVFITTSGSYLVYTSFTRPDLPPTPTKTPSPADVGQDLALALPTVTAQPTDTPTPLPPTGTPTPLYGGGVHVELVLHQSSWVQISVDGVEAFEGILQPGDRRDWSGQRRVAIRAGNAGGVEVIVNGVNKGRMGEEGQVIDQVWEKVEDPANLTPEPTETPEVLPLESAPDEGDDTQ